MTQAQQTHLAALAEHVRALTEPYDHHETHEVQSKYVPESKDKHGKNYLIRRHKSSHASLLDQLRECRYDRAQTAQEAAVREAATVPHIDLDAVDRLVAISEAVQKWLTAFEVESRTQAMAIRLHRYATETMRLFPDIRMMPKEIIRACAVLRVQAAELGKRFDYDLPVLVGIAANGPETAAELSAEAGRWVVWCRVFAGWETPPWRPRARCPQCDTAAGVDGDQPAGLRVRLDIRSAVCLTCDATWSDGGVPIEQLAKHIQATTDLPLTAEQTAALVDHGKARAGQNRGGKA
jgi:hypothetical protein